MTVRSVGHVIDADGLVVVYREALLSAGYSVDALPPSSSGTGRPRAASREAFEVFAALAGAPDVLAVLELFASQSGLRERDDFSVSCLPGNGRAPKGKCRASVVSVGWVEVLVVELDRSHGGLAQVSVWGEPNEDITWAAELAGVSIQSSRLDGDGIALRLPGAMALKLLSDDKVAQLVSRRISAIRGRRRRSRRLDWHNSWLWAFLDACAASPRSVCSVDDWDVSRSDSVVLAHQRNSQSDFRRRLLEFGPVECAICGLDLPALLEAAHLVPHARGGRASRENGRLLCANHHRAYDAGLYRWTGEEFEWASAGEEPNLGGPRPSSHG